MPNLVITADWHIRIKPDIDEQWQLNRYKLLINEVIKVCHEHDGILVLAGDILDRNRPSLSELKLVMHLLHKANAMGIQTYLISGNHESLGLGASTYDFLSPFMAKLENVSYNTSQEIFVPLEDDVDLYLVGHPALADYELGDLRPNKTNILVSHFRPTVNQFIQEEIDVEKFIAPFDVCFAGDIHLPLTLHDAKLIYVNHPVNSCFEKLPDCSLVLAKASGAGMAYKRIPLALPNLVQINTTPEAYSEPEDDFNFYRVEITGSPEELRSIKSSKPTVKLLKVPEVLDAFAEVAEDSEIQDVALEDALVGYMKELNMDEENISQMMAVYRETDDGA